VQRLWVSRRIAPNTQLRHLRAYMFPISGRYTTGGVYADLDVEALRPMDELLRGGRPVLAFLSATWWLRHNIPNAWMASPPGHEFWRVRAPPQALKL
jgi:hypothetical protein